MYLRELRKATTVCLWADVVPDIQGHRGIGKTEMVRQIGLEWKDPFTDFRGLPVVALYCATQEVTDLIGFPTKVWESTGKPVVEGIAPDNADDRIITSWAPPNWLTRLHRHCAQFEEQDRKTLEKMKEDGASEDEIWLFWNRPKCIVFLDESRRAQRDVMQAMYPLILNKTLHTHELPRGTRIITADNYTGAYDVREPDEAYMSRFCHLEAEADVSSWYDWSLNNDIHPKIGNFLAANPTFLLQVPEDQQEAVVKYVPQPDPRRWVAVSRIEKYGRAGVAKCGIKIGDSIIKQVLHGLVGIAATEQYWDFNDDVISIDDILAGKAELGKTFEKITGKVDREKLKEKLQLETPVALKDRRFNKKEAVRLAQFLLELDAKERVTAILQSLFILKNSGNLTQKWIDTILENNALIKTVGHLAARKNISM